MKPSVRFSLLTVALLALLLCIALVFTSAPKYPIALLRVVDSSGKPISGAVVKPEGLRTKPGPYVSGWYGWMGQLRGVPDNPVTTDADGYAAVAYPKYVFEQIETGTIIVSVNHPQFVPERPERIVASAPPAGAPWRVRIGDLWARIQHKTLVVRPDPIVLEKGATLVLSLRADSSHSEGTLFAQSSGVWDDSGFWLRPAPDQLVTHRFAPGLQTVRLLQLSTNGAAQFSEVLSVQAVSGQTNVFAVSLKPGVTVRGQLDASVPRPVKQGRAIFHVWPEGLKPENSPPQWHAWAAISSAGNFEVRGLPSGNLEVVALCNGFVSTNGPGQFHMRYPQKFRLETNDLSIVVGMEPTARLEVEVLDNNGNPLKGAKVETWPNVRYGEWSATILGGDCYNTSDQFLSRSRAGYSFPAVPDFEATTDSSGLAVLSNLPSEVSEFHVEHSNFVLPAVVVPNGEKRRQSSVTLTPGQNTRITVRLEPRNQSPIRHY